ncbi:hypothetical protein [Lactobacillus sp. LL6]|uniref:Rgg family transcriptional regulator n=1 Tax=Lactobacillus sp. LL6 TaxID=2596827 RepID=UPI002413377F|nr:hypothetical protein [Lactobacillus sp. LL6]
MRKVAENITSPSSLQRWENGQGEMSVEKVGKLLNKLHIQSDELIDNSNILDIYTATIEKAVKDNDEKSLKKIAKKLINYYYRNPESEQLFFKAAIACNFYMDFTNECLLENDDLVRLKLYFSKIEVWNQEDILLFANTELLLPALSIYINARKIYSALVEEKENFYYKYLAMNALISAVFCLIEKQDFENARFIFKQIKTIDLSDKYLNEITRINYLNTLFKYLETDDLTKMNEFLTGLRNIGLESKAKEFELGFSKFIKLRKK